MDHYRPLQTTMDHYTVYGVAQGLLMKQISDPIDLCSRMMHEFSPNTPDVLFFIDLIQMPIPVAHCRIKPNCNGHDLFLGCSKFGGMLWIHGYTAQGEWGDISPKALTPGICVFRWLPTDSHDMSDAPHIFRGSPA